MIYLVVIVGRGCRKLLVNNLLDFISNRFRSEGHQSLSDRKPQKGSSFHLKFTAFLTLNPHNTRQKRC